jgi:hypothetical protein
VTRSKLEILHDHYKDTFSHQLGYLKRRNRFSLYLFLALVIMFLEVTSPNGTETIISKLISEYLGDSVSLETDFVRCLTWLFLFGLVVQYCQTTVSVERQYVYLHKLEKELTPFFSSKIPFTREGESYLKNYPMLSNWIDILYKWVFPVVLVAFTGVKLLWIEFPNDGFNLAWIISVVFCLMVWITIGIYFVFNILER